MLRRLGGLLCVVLLVATSVGGYAPPPPKVDLLVCIDVTGFGPTIDALRLAVGTFLDRVFASVPSIRVGLVVHSTREGTAAVRSFALTDNNADLKRALGSMAASAADVSGDVYQELLTMLKDSGQVAWRPDARRVVLLVGRSAPEPGTSLPDEIATAAREAGGVRIFPVLAGGPVPAGRLLADLARRTGGLMAGAAALDQVEAAMYRLFDIGGSFADARSIVDGRIVQVMGGDFEVEIEGAGQGLHPGLQVLVFSRETPGLLIGDGPVTVGEGRRYLVQSRSSLAFEPIAVGCPVKIINN